MRHKEEVCHGIPEGKAQSGKFFLDPLPGGDDLPAALLKVSRIRKSRLAKLQGRAVHRIGIEGIFHIIQIFDEHLASECITDSHTRHGPGF